MASLSFERALDRIQVNQKFGHHMVVYDGRIKDLVESVFLGSYIAPAIYTLSMKGQVTGQNGEYMWQILPWTADHPRPVTYPLSPEEMKAPVQGPAMVVA